MEKPPVEQKEPKVGKERLYEILQQLDIVTADLKVRVSQIERGIMKLDENEKKEMLARIMRADDAVGRFLVYLHKSPRTP